ncbi:hypothetical protein ACJMK2_002178 [Sinanodonta woodiana]|uniref:Uncharacterized protein n=1 Tax=Sinanodonta woodiana TaxID=1069815 RepID=A0ABD3XUI9_SINWO
MASFCFTVKKALELNRNLMYINEHQKCILAMKNADLSRLQSEVLDLKSIKEKECLLKDCENWKEKYQGSVTSLQEAHSLIAVNLQNLERYRSEVRGNEERIEELEAEIDEATLSMTSVNRMIEEERKAFSTAEQKWHAQEERYLCDIQQLKTELSVLKTQMEKKDLAQQEVVNQVTCLNKELDMLKTIVNVEKESLSCQTELCMLKVEDHDCQTVIEVQCQKIQTEKNQMNTSTTQTINAAFKNCACQTNTSITQTINAALRNCACQTENISYNSFSDSPSIPSTQDLELPEQISAQRSFQIPEDHMNKNVSHNSERENTGIKCIRKGESDIGCRVSSEIQTPVESEFVDVARIISNTKLDNQYADEEFEATLNKSEVSGNIAEFYSVNYHKSIFKNKKLDAESEHHPSCAVSLVTNITLSSSSGNTNDNLSIVIEDETPEESENILNSSDSNLHGKSHWNDDIASADFTIHRCVEDSHLRSEEGIHEEENLKNENFNQHTEIPQEKEDKKEKEDEIIAPSQPSIFSDGSLMLPTGKKRGLMEGDKCIRADESLVSKPKHFKSEIVNKILDENFVESSLEIKPLHLVRRVTYPPFYKSSPHNTVDTKHASSHDQVRLSGHMEKQNPFGKDNKSSNMDQDNKSSNMDQDNKSSNMDQDNKSSNMDQDNKSSNMYQATSCNKICVGTPSAMDENLSSFMTPTIYMQRCKETRLSLSTKMLPGLQSSEKGQCFSSNAGFSPLHRIPQYRLATKRSLVAQVSSLKQSSVSSPGISAVTKSCTPKPSAYSTQDIPSVDVKTEKPKTSLPRFGFLDRKRSIFDEDFNLSSDRVESSAVHTEAPHVLYSRFLSNVKPLKSSNETKEAVRCFSVLVSEPGMLIFSVLVKCTFAINSNKLDKALILTY